MACSVRPVIESWNPIFVDVVRRVTTSSADRRQIRVEPHTAVVERRLMSRMRRDG